MGLDQYLEGHIQMSHRSAIDNWQSIPTHVPHKAIAGKELERLVYEAGYWRKQYDLSAWFREHCKPPLEDDPYAKMRVHPDVLRGLLVEANRYLAEHDLCQVDFGLDLNAQHTADICEAALAAPDLTIIFYYWESF